MENDRKQNNDLDNWEKKGMNKGKQAERYNIMAERSFYISIIILALGVIFPFIFIEYEWKYHLMQFPIIIASILYMISVTFTVIGYKMDKEKVKNMVMLHTIVPGATIVGLGICLIILYIFWNAFNGIGSSGVTFWQWIF